MTQKQVTENYIKENKIIYTITSLIYESIVSMVYETYVGIYTYIIYFHSIMYSC